MGERSRRNETEVPKEIKHRGWKEPHGWSCRHGTLPKDLQSPAPKATSNSILCTPRGRRNSPTHQLKESLFLGNSSNHSVTQQANCVSTILLRHFITYQASFFPHTHPPKEAIIPFPDGKTQQLKKLRNTVTHEIFTRGKKLPIRIQIQACLFLHCPLVCW